MLTKLLLKIKKSTIAINIIKLITGSAVGQIIIVLASPLLTRLYSPDEFGLLAIYVSIVSILSVIISLRYETAVVLPKENHKAIDLVLLSILIAFGFSLFLILVVFIFNEQLTKIIGFPEFSFYLWLMPISTFTYGCFQTFNYFLTRQQSFNRLAISHSIKGFGTAGTQLTWGWFLYPGAFGLILGQIAGNSLPSLYLFYTSFKDIIKRITPLIRQNLKVVLIEYKLFPLFTSWTTLLNAISQNIPALLLALLFSPAVAGYFAVAARVMTAPIALIGNSVRQVYYQRASEMYNQGQNLLPLFTKMTRNLAAIAVLPVLIILIWGKEIFGVVLGSSWEEAGIYASILSLWLFVFFISRPSISSILILRLNKFQLYIEIFLLIFRLLALLCGALLFKDIYITIGLFALVGVIFNVFVIGLVYFKLRQAHLNHSLSM